MKKFKIKYVTSPIVLIALAVAVIAGYLVYWDINGPKPVVANTTPEVVSDYTFKAVKLNKNTFVEVYKKNELAQTVLVQYGTIDEKSFTVSPDQNSVTFTITIAQAEGTKTVQGMIDLKTYKYTTK